MKILVRVSEFLTETMNSTYETVSDPTFHLAHLMERCNHHYLNKVGVMIIMVRVSESLNWTMNSTLETVSDPTWLYSIDYKHHYHLYLSL